MLNGSADVAKNVEVSHKSGTMETGSAPSARRMRKGMAVLVSGTAIGQVISLGASPIITRIYSAADFGVLAIISSLLSLIGVVSALKLELAVPVPRSRITAANIAAAAALSVGISGLAALLVIGLLVGIWGHAQFLAMAAGPLLLLPFGIVAMGMYRILTYWHLRERTYSAVARTKPIQSAVSVSLQIVVGLVRPGPFGLVIGYIVGQAGGVMSLLRALQTDLRQLASHVTKRRLVAAVSEYRRFPLISAPAGFVNSVGLYAPPVLLAALYGPTVAGLYALADRITNLPATLIGTAAGQVYLGEAARVQVNPREANILLLSTVKRLFLVALGPALVLFVASPRIFDGVFGSGWMESGVYAQILVLAVLCRFIVNPVSQSLELWQRQDVYATWSIIRASVIVGGLIGAWWIGLSPRLAVGVYSGLVGIAYIVLLYFIMTISRQRVAPDTDGERHRERDSAN